MFIIRKLKTHTSREILNLKVVQCRLLCRQLQTYYTVYNKHEYNGSETEFCQVIKQLQKYEDKILYSGYMESNRLAFGYRQHVIDAKKQNTEERNSLFKLQSIEPLPLSLKYFLPENSEKDVKFSKEVQKVHIHFPFEDSDSPVLPVKNENYNQIKSDVDVATLADIEIRTRLQVLNNSQVNWMTAYDNYNDEVLENDNNWQINYGTPNPKYDVSDVPCGGCGALLHCKDTSIPGYIPSEIFQNYKKGGIHLNKHVCQRCHFLNTYNLALQVRVAADDYPQVLKTIGDRKRALVVLIIDMLDFPCSIWPGIADLLGPGRPIYVVGNKIDLLPQDGKGFLERVTHALENSVREAGFATVDMKGISLISAKTGFGIEEFVTKLFNIWKYKGDVFLVGCTNVGKSSLFNALLQSDYCKSQASNLIQRATTSPWPGTTLNLLKFPIMRPTGWKLFVRNKRLISANKLIAQENKLKKAQLKGSKDTVKYATLIGHIDKTFAADEPIKETNDPFSVQEHANISRSIELGLDENDEQYVLNKWCYDTPGVVQHDQIIHLLTTDELMLTLPKELLKPQTFCLRPGTTIFIAGLGRLDYVEGNNFARFTVFCSSSLPITICNTDSANSIYEEFLGSDVFLVPMRNPDRLKLWPGLEHAGDYTVKGADWECSCADVVLSNAGWVAVACGPEFQCKLRAWTPEKRGVYLRESLLPKAVSLRGKKFRHSPAYRNDKFYVQQ